MKRNQKHLWWSKRPTDFLEIPSCRILFLKVVFIFAGTLAHAEDAVSKDSSVTSGNCSPIVERTGGSVTINCPGVDQKAMQRLNELLDKKDVELTAKIQEADNWANKYRMLSAQIANTDDGGVLAKSAKASLSVGDLDQARSSLAELRNQLDEQKREFTTTQRIVRTSIKDSLAQISGEGIAAGGVFHQASKWSKTPLRICFLTGDRAIRSYIASIAQEWTLYANIDFDFGQITNPRLCTADEQNDVRVSLAENGFWAYVGTTAVHVPGSVPTLNLQFSGMSAQEVVNGQFRGEILHEFGHVLGFDHSFQNPGAHCVSEINLDALYAWAEKLGFSKDTARSIIASPQPGTDIAAGVFDNKSVMNYPLPAEILKNGTASPCFVPAIQELSLKDKLSAAKAYP